MADVVAAVKEVGTVSVSTPSVRVPPEAAAMVPSWVAETGALPVHPVVLKVDADEVAVLLAASILCTWK